jgi:hypothetical protein
MVVLAILVGIGVLVTGLMQGAIRDSQAQVKAQTTVSSSEAPRIVR